MDMDDGTLSGRADTAGQLADEIADLLRRVDRLPSLDPAQGAKFSATAKTAFPSNVSLPPILLLP